MCEPIALGVRACVRARVCVLRLCVCVLMSVCAVVCLYVDI